MKKKAKIKVRINTSNNKKCNQDIKKLIPLRNNKDVELSVIFYNGKD